MVVSTRRKNPSFEQGLRNKQMAGSRSSGNLPVSYHVAPKSAASNYPTWARQQDNTKDEIIASASDIESTSRHPNSTRLIEETQTTHQAPETPRGSPPRSQSAVFTQKQKKTKKKLKNNITLYFVSRDKRRRRLRIGLKERPEPNPVPSRGAVPVHLVKGSIGGELDLGR